MAENKANPGGARRNRWSAAIWGGAAALLLMPLVAMQFTDDMKWDETDFIALGAMLFAACGSYELATRLSPNPSYRAAAGVTVVTAFVLVWVNLAVGVFGNEDNPSNLMFGGVLAVAAIGAILARFDPSGMAWALVATAAAQLLVAATGLVLGFGKGALLAAMFAVPWLLSARLFGKAAREHPPARP